MLRSALTRFVSRAFGFVAASRVVFPALEAANT